ncbi:YbaB/EbfC family nucleoid-associated protein [Nocardia sp. R7R-8]|uniref:YbaB/EbfC family nucleoid-associated protein n=1 Tax=Nocardia sp. R7R-8 TaxID=3459304 RepID=UPI00403DC2D0
MTNEQAKADLADILDGVQEQMRIIARLQQERAELTGRATVRGKRVTVVVNADNTVIDTQFGTDIEDLSHAEIAKAVTEAAQQASAEVARKTRELMAPLETHRARMPKLSDLVEGMPEVRAPEPIPAPTAAPNARERREFSDGSGMRFTDTETVERHRGGSVTDSSW